MAINIPIQVYERLEQKFGKEEAREIIHVLESVLEEINLRANDTLERIREKADAEIAQKKFEIKNELVNELATKADIARLEGEINLLRQEMQTLRQEMKTLRQEMQTLRQEMLTMKISLDRKYMIMYLILLFTIIFMNQNALVFIARLLGLVQ